MLFRQGTATPIQTKYKIKMNRLNLLLVEDSENDAHFVNRILNKTLPEASCKWVTDGLEAVEFLQSLESSIEQPELVLLDLKLPKISGLQVLEKIRKNEKTKHLPVVIYSSSGEVKDIEQAYSIGANSYLIKPADYIEMKENLGLTFKYWLTKNQLVS